MKEVVMLGLPVDRVLIVNAAFLFSGLASMLVLSTLCELAAMDFRGNGR
jgi:hypothetical protein